MSVIQILLGQWLLLACRLSGEAGVAVCVWLPCGNLEDLKQAVRCLVFAPTAFSGSPQITRVLFPLSAAYSKLSSLFCSHLPDRDSAEGLSLYPSRDFICLP